MIDFTARQLSIISVTKINPTTELALFLGRVTILDFIYIYGHGNVDVWLNLLYFRRRFVNFFMFFAYI